MYAISSTYREVSSKFQINPTWHGWENPSFLRLRFFGVFGIFLFVYVYKMLFIIKSSKQYLYANLGFHPKVSTKFQINMCWNAWENPSFVCSYTHTHTHTSMIFFNLYGIINRYDLATLVATEKNTLKNFFSLGIF